MAAPHGDIPKNLNTGFIESLTPDAFPDAQVGFPKSYTLEFDDAAALGSTSSTFHNNLEPSILSIFNESSAEEAEIQIDVESEASLLSAFSEMLDSVIEDTLSPFDTLPDSKLFVNQRSQDSRVRLHCLDREAAPRVTRSFTSSNSKAASLHSDRQLRPRLHRKTQTATLQRSDGEEEDFRETRRRPVRIFRIESDPELCEVEQPDEILPISLLELIRHMHPYSIRVAMDKKECLRDVQELQEDDVFVDVEGDDDYTAETPLSLPDVSKSSDPGLKQLVLHLQNPEAIGTVPNSSQEDMPPNCGEQNKVNTAKVVSSRKTKKTVRFAPDVASIHVYQVEDEAENGGVPHDSPPTEHTNDLKISHERSQTSDLSGDLSWEAKTMSSQNSAIKHKTLSLQEYRLLRQKMLPKEVKKTDYRTKWPSVPETPKELPLIPCIPGYNTSQVNVQPLSNPRPSTRGAVVKPRRNLHLPLRSRPRQNALVRKPVQSVDPPNPVTVCLPPDAKISLPPSEEQKVMQKKYCKSQMSRTNPYHPAAVQSSSYKDPPTNCSTISDNISIPSPPETILPVQVSQESLPQVQTAVSSHIAERKRQQSAEEKGIEATDVTSLLEQFETQGLTPPATPPHQIWNPLTTTLKSKQHEATKPSPSKTIQIIEPKPLPPSKIQAKPQPSSSIPAPSLFLAFIDHDYCITQDFRPGKKRALSNVYMHNSSHKESRNYTSHMQIDNRTSCETESLSASVLLSPEASPSQLEAKRTGKPADTEVRRRSRCSCSPSSPVRGRTRKRQYHRRYHHYDTSSVSSSRSSSCSSSASSCSPPRKRYRSRNSESSSSSSSRSSSQSLSPSPIRGRQWRYCRSQSRSFNRSRSRSSSPQPDWRRKLSSWKRPREHCHPSRGKDAHKDAKQKAIEERRVVYVGKIRSTMTKDELWERFVLFGKIEDCTVHFRSDGDNYGFVTYYNTDDAFAAIEKGKKLRQPDELPFDICFGGRRQFCKSNYMDLDSKYDMDPAPSRSKDNTLDFDTLLKEAQRGLKT